MANNKTRYYNHKMLNDRTIDELIGITKGITADGIVNKDEATFLLKWMQKNAAYSKEKIINTLYSRIREMLSDNILNQAEQKELLDILRSISGETCPDDQLQATAASFPLNNPPPEVIIKNKFFCMTGKFAYGPRRICEAAIKEKGGKVKGNVSNWVDYLVIGSLCSDQWAHTSFGRKIEDALLLQRPERERPYGEKIAVIHEDHWAKYMFQK